MVVGNTQEQVVDNKQERVVDNKSRAAADNKLAVGSTEVRMTHNQNLLLRYSYPTDQKTNLLVLNILQRWLGLQIKLLLILFS